MLDIPHGPFCFNLPVPYVQTRCLTKLALSSGRGGFDVTPSRAVIAVREEGAHLLLMACHQNVDNVKAAVSSLLEARGLQPVGTEKSGLDGDVNGTKVSHFCLSFCAMYLCCRSFHLVHFLAFMEIFRPCSSHIRQGNANVYLVFVEGHVVCKGTRGL